MRISLLGMLGILSCPIIAFAADDDPPAQCTSPEVVEFAGKPTRYFFDHKYNELVQYSKMVMDCPEYSMEQRKNSMTALAVMHLSQAQPLPAKAACMEILKMDPCGQIDPTVPMPVKHFFYDMQDSMLLQASLLCPQSLRTIAVGDIENNLGDSADFEAEKLCRGLGKIIINDLVGATSMRVVDRDRLQTLVAEIKQSAEQDDSEVRVRAGRLLGAQTYLFGSLTQVGKNEYVLSLRLDQTETSLVLASAQEEMKIKTGKDVVKLERKVLIDVLVPKLQELLSQAEAVGNLKRQAEDYFKSRKIPSDSKYMAYVLAVGEAEVLEGRGDMKGARAAWAKAAAANPFDPEAAQRAAYLESFPVSGSE